MDNPEITPRESSSVAVVGAGVAGLSAAHRLQQLGFSPTVFEESSRVGGRIQSFRQGPYLYDTGAFIYLGSYTESLELMNEVGLKNEIARVNAYGAMPRDGALHYLDLRRPVRALVGTKYLSTMSKLRAIKLLVLLARHWRDLDYNDASGLAGPDDDSVSSYCYRELNEELAEYLGAVVVRGPWLCDPENSSLAQLLWTMKNFFKPYFYGLDGGMGSLTDALASGLKVELGTKVNRVNHGDRGVTVDVAGAGTTDRTLDFDYAVVATTADRALEIYPQMSGAQRALYSSTKYISSVNTHLVLHPKPAVPATYILVSPRENKDLCGVIVDDKKARGRVPEGDGMITVFCRDAWCVDHLQQSDEAILDEVLGMIKPYYGDLTNYVVEYQIGRWPQVVPKMPQGRYRQIIEYEKTLKDPTRVALAGDLDPIGGVNAALVSGRKAAERLRSFRGSV